MTSLLIHAAAFYVGTSLLVACVLVGCLRVCARDEHNELHRDAAALVARYGYPRIFVDTFLTWPSYGVDLIRRGGDR